MTMQTLVMAHAAFGHNHFFKNNYLFRQWTDANGILDYLSFARDYVAKCEERHGVEAVERVLDAAHALKDHGVNRYAHRTQAQPRGGAAPGRGMAGALRGDLQRFVAHRARRRKGQGGSRRGRGAAAGDEAGARPARGEPAVSHREAGSAARGLATRAGPHRPVDLRSTSTRRNSCR